MNGWTNKNTWTVALWIGNDEHMYHYAALKAQSSPETLERSISSKVTKGLRGLALDLMTNALSDVNWQEIASDLCEDTAGVKT